MKHYIILILGIAALLTSCNEQDRNGDNLAQSTEIYEENHEDPVVHIKVNRKYDSEGNLVAFDSLYTSFYSSAENDTMMMDSLFSTFKDFYSENYPLMFERRLSDLFMNDSLFYNDFFHDDFFNKRVSLNSDYFKKMMIEMDSIKNKFYQRHSQIKMTKPNP